MRLSRRHKEYTGWLYLISVGVNDVIAGSLPQVQYLEEVVTVRVLYGKMAVCIEYLGLKWS